MSRATISVIFRALSYLIKGLGIIVVTMAMSNLMIIRHRLNMFLGSGGRYRFARRIGICNPSFGIDDRHDKHDRTVGPWPGAFWGTPGCMFLDRRRPLILLDGRTAIVAGC